MDWSMVLKMTAAVLLYVLITAALWYACRKEKPLSLGLKILIGLVFGACSVAANHIGIQFHDRPVLNVRDIGPLSAGLFFSPLSGIIAGIIGGGERFLAGELWGIGRFTEVACSLSTCLAGFLAAFLHKWVYKGTRPSVPQAFFLGALTEVFHMYAILFTNRGDMTMGYTVVKTISIPMIAFTAAGMALCTIVVKRLAGDKLEPNIFVSWRKIPVGLQVQRWLLVVTVALFMFNFAGSYRFQNRMAIETASAELVQLGQRFRAIYDKTGDIRVVLGAIEIQETLNYSITPVDLTDGRIPSAEEEGAAPAYLGHEGLGFVKENLDQLPFEMPARKGGRTLAQAVSIGGEYATLTERDLSSVYENLESVIYEDTLSDILLFTVLYILISFLVEHLVVRNLKRVNVSLDRITNGSLDEKVDVRTSPEFSGLSDDINETVDALKGYIHAAEKRMEDELKLAAAIQSASLPKNFRLPTDKVELYALMTPARQVGGDFYDLFFSGPNTLCLVIADVSGKGVPASLFMMRAKTAIKYYARSGQGPAELLKNVNSALFEENDAEMFVTLWLGMLDLNTGLMRCCNAGHEYPMLMRAGGGYEILKDRHGMVLAAMEVIRAYEYEIQFRPGDRLCVYTDGVAEAVNEKLEQYGTDRLAERLNQLKDSDQQTILEGVLNDIRRFAGTADQFDDITLLGLTYRGDEKAAPARGDAGENSPG